MEVYLVRHGKTVWNEARRMQGRSDIELSENGRYMAIELGKVLENTEFERIYASPLIRAYETAALIRGWRNIPIIRDNRIQEISFGCKEGTACSEWQEKEGEFSDFFFAPDMYQPPEGAESIDEIKLRAKEFIIQVIEPLSSSLNRVMIVAHGAVNRAMISYFENLENKDYWQTGVQKNCEALVYVFDENGWRRRE